MIRTLIVDDEPLARAVLRQMLAARADIQIVGEAGSGTDAVTEIRRLRPELVLLDIQMPGMDGFDVLRALDEKPLPQVVFVTAYESYALRAFEVHALDYLLKPFDEQRLGAALDRVHARQSHDTNVTAQRIIDLLQTLERRGRGVARIPVRHGTKTVLLPVDSIDLIESEGKFLHITADGSRYVLRETIYQLAQMLDGDQFLRISRSAIINITSIEEILPRARGDYVVVLRGGLRVASTRAFRDELTRRLEGI